MERRNPGHFKQKECVLELRSLYSMENMIACVLHMLLLAFIQMLRMQD